MERDDAIRQALREYAEGDVGVPDLESIRARYPRDRRYGPAQTLLAVAVVLLIVAGGIFVVTRSPGTDREEQPIGPSPSVSSLPSPTESASADPTPSPETSVSPSVPQPSSTDFPVNPDRGVNPGPVGGVGDTIAGLRLDRVEIEPGQCGSELCPAVFTFEFTNTTGQDQSWQVMAYTYRDGTSTLGNGAQVDLSAGESGLTRIQIDTSQAPGGNSSATYSWNWSASIGS